MLVKLKHGTCIYKGIRHATGDELEITELFYKTNSTRFEKVEVEVTVNIQNIIPENKPAKKSGKKSGKKSQDGGKDI